MGFCRGGSAVMLWVSGFGFKTSKLDVRVWVLGFA